MGRDNQELHYESDEFGREGGASGTSPRCRRTTGGDYGRTACILLETRDVIYVRVKLNAHYPGHDNAGIENEGLTDRRYLGRLHNGRYYLIAIAIACVYVCACHIRVYINEQLDYESHLDKSPF